MPRLGPPRWRLVCPLAAILAALTAAELPVGAGASTSLPAASASAVRAYWTPARMRNALPGSLLTPGGSAKATSEKRATLHERVTHIRRAPLRAHGKVFFTVVPYDYQCSATAVRAPSESLVITAGHCSYDHNALNPLGNAVQNWEFVPAYDRGQKPFGAWPGTTSATPQWQASGPTISPTGDILGGDLRFDVGAATVAPRNGHTLQSVVGGRKMAFDRPREQRYLAIGYPAESPFNGRREFSCDSPYRGPDGSNGAPATIGISCDMTGGSSGGGWVNASGRLVSVTSYSMSNHPNTLYGPYFGAAIQSFYASVKNG